MQMPAYADMTTEELAAKRDELMREYEAIKAKGLALNMARGKPSIAQLDLSMPMLASVTTYEDCLAEDGTDCRNYGVLDGIPEAKRLMASMLDDDADHVIVFGSSSLNIMYDTMARCWSASIMPKGLLSPPAGRLSRCIISTGILRPIISLFPGWSRRFAAWSFPEATACLSMCGIIPI